MQSPIRSARLLRFAFGSLLLLAGMVLLAAQALAWLDLEPCLLQVLEDSATCALGLASS